MHGYQILTQVQHDSRGLIKPNRGSIYRTLHNLAEWKWLDFDGKIYSLNSISRRMLEVEIEYHRHVLDVIDRRQPPKTTQLADNKIDLDAFLP